jgi:hypothetical protein
MARTLLPDPRKLGGGGAEQKAQCLAMAQGRNQDAICASTAAVRFRAACAAFIDHKREERPTQSSYDLS